MRKRSPEPDLSGCGKLVRKRVPQYVHAPDTVRALVDALGQHEEKEREAVFRQAHYLLSEEKEIVVNAMICAYDPKKRKAITLRAFEGLFRTINIGHRDHADMEIVRRILLHLRFYTIIVEPELIQSMVAERPQMDKLVVSSVMGLVRKVYASKTPARQASGVAWDSSGVDDWIAEAVADRNCK